MSGSQRGLLLARAATLGLDTMAGLQGCAGARTPRPTALLDSTLFMSAAILLLLLPTKKNNNS